MMALRVVKTPCMATTRGSLRDILGTGGRTCGRQSEVLTETDWIGATRADSVSLSPREYHSPQESITLPKRVKPGRLPCGNGRYRCYKPDWRCTKDVWRNGLGQIRRRWPCGNGGYKWPDPGRDVPYPRETPRQIPIWNRLQNVGADADDSAPKGSADQCTADRPVVTKTRIAGQTQDGPHKPRAGPRHNKPVPPGRSRG